MVVFSRYLALLFGIGLAIGEAVINWGHWQYAPLWIVDYIIAGWLLLGFVRTRDKECAGSLQAPWAFTCGVFYMALFVSLNLKRDHPELYGHSNTMLYLIGGMLLLALTGLATATVAARKS
ncbi:MAG: hypothetical protein AMXMBFR84_17830 [Candidatus Hydrogenedentota bacterium]